MNGSSERASESVADSDAVGVAKRYVGAYTDRDLDAMLAVMDENVVSHPAPLFGHRPQRSRRRLLYSVTSIAACRPLTPTAGTVRLGRLSRLLTRPV